MLVSLVRGGFWRKRPSNRSSWAKKFCAGVGIPALNVADNRSASKSLYCHLTALEPCTEAFSKSSVVGPRRAGWALTTPKSVTGTLSPPLTSYHAKVGRPMKHQLKWTKKQNSHGRHS